MVVIARMTTPIKPVHEIRVGRIKAAIWFNSTENGIRHSLTVSRLYKTEAGWRSSDSFGRDDIPLLIKVLVRVHDWMYTDTEDIENPAE